MTHFPWVLDRRLLISVFWSMTMAVKKNWRLFPNCSEILYRLVEDGRSLYGEPFNLASFGSLESSSLLYLDFLPCIVEIIFFCIIEIIWIWIWPSILSSIDRVMEGASHDLELDVDERYSISSSFFLLCFALIRVWIYEFMIFLFQCK